LKPYSDLIAKKDNDPKHQKFLIDAIKNIFDGPIDKAFGLKRESKTDIK